jgi:L-lactate permease
MIVINMFDSVGSFASNKDVAKEIRTNVLLPKLAKKEDIIIDFDKVEGATQSFVHALISEAIRKYGVDTFLNLVCFKSCNQTIQSIITIVTDYMQAGLDERR